MAKLIQYCTNASRYDGPFDNVAGWPAAGMGYLLVGNGDRLVVIDGGHDEDAEGMLALIEAYGGRNPVVELWILTHPHGDHIGALRRIAKEDALRARVTIKTLLYHFPAEFRDKRGGNCQGAIRDLERVAATTGATVRLPRVDERFSVDGMQFHMLYTPTDCTILNNPNQLSLIFTVRGPRKKWMVTGDAFRRNLQIVLWRYDKELAADILQLPHHGLCDTGNAEFYKRVGADIVLVPISAAGDRTMSSNLYGDAPAVNRAAREAAHTVHPAYHGTVELEI